MTDGADKPVEDKPVEGKPAEADPAAPLVPNPPILPSPAEAAMNAAIIVSEMVDIHSESGAVIAAAAAAGAAIEAATAAKKAAEAEAATSKPNLAAMTDVPTADAATADPVTTVKLSRDRIVAALNNEPEPGGPRHPRARTEPGPRERARSSPGETPLVVPTVDEAAPMPEQPFEDFDPVAVAAAAITRLRMRAKTDLGQLRLQYQRHDGVVLFLALLIIIVAGYVHGNSSRRRSCRSPSTGSRSITRPRGSIPSRRRCLRRACCASPKGAHHLGSPTASTARITSSSRRRSTRARRSRCSSTTCRSGRTT